jgi:hypothetical protein
MAGIVLFFLMTFLFNHTLYAQQSSCEWYSEFCERGTLKYTSDCVNFGGNTGASCTCGSASFDCGYHQGGEQ